MIFAPPPVRSIPRQSILVFAVSFLQSNQSKVVSLLLGAYADVNARDKQQRTPLHLCSELGHETVAKVSTLYNLFARAVSQYQSRSTLASDRVNRTVGRGERKRRERVYGRKILSRDLDARAKVATCLETGVFNGYQYPAIYPSCLSVLFKSHHIMALRMEKHGEQTSAKTLILPRCSSVSSLIAVCRQRWRGTA